ncbi:hypothetical protein TURU_056441 [Turdus rufiventris]|nr:hypothetical protein TURU_056441 [Turdus rufiventris]
MPARSLCDICNLYMFMEKLRAVMWKHQAGAASPPQPQKGHIGHSLAKPGLVSLFSLDRQHPGFSILIEEEAQISLRVLKSETGGQWRGGMKSMGQVAGALQVPFYQGDGSIGAQLKDEPADILGHSTVLDGLSTGCGSFAVCLLQHDLIYKLLVASARDDDEKANYMMGY